MENAGQAAGGEEEDVKEPQTANMELEHRGCVVASAHSVQEKQLCFVRSSLPFEQRKMSVLMDFISSLSEIRRSNAASLVQVSLTG